MRTCSPSRRPASPNPMRSSSSTTPAASATFVSAGVARVKRPRKLSSWSKSRSSMPRDWRMYAQGRSRSKRTPTRTARRSTSTVRHSSSCRRTPLPRRYRKNYEPAKSNHELRSKTGSDQDSRPSHPQPFERRCPVTRWIVGSSLKFRPLVVALALIVMMFGITRLSQMPVDVFPEILPVTVSVQTEALGLSAAEVEQLITVPIEADLLTGTPWVEAMRSESVPGLSSIEMVFKPGTNPMHARQMVQERLTQAHALPNVSKPPQMLQPLSSTNRVMLIGLSSKTESLIQMSVLARWTIRPRLMGVPGVANV